MSYYRRLIEESEKKRILGMHNGYKHNPKTWVIREAYSGKPGEGFEGDAAACKKQNPYNAAVKIGLVKNMTDWGQLKKDFGSDGTMTQNLALLKAICDGWRKGDQKEGGSQTPTGEQQPSTQTPTGEQPKDGGTQTPTGEQPGTEDKKYSEEYITPTFGQTPKAD